MKEIIKMKFSQLRSRVGGQLVFDLAAWYFAIVLSAVSRFDFNVNDINYTPLILLATIAATLQTVLGNLSHLYRGRFIIATFDELKALLITTASVGIPLALITLVAGPVWGIPRSTLILAAPIFLVLSGTTRVIRRVLRTNVRTPGENQRTLIYGAGSMAESLIPQLLQDPKSQFLPIGLLDDSEQKTNRWINGVPMLGPWRDFPKIAKQSGVEVVIVCIARADASFLKKVEEDCRRVGAKVIVLPSLDEVLQGHTGVSDLRALSIEDLVGRRPIDTQVDQIASYIQGEVVLVTGAGGSIGSELCKQISRFKPSKLIMLDRDETGLQLAQIGVSGHGLLDTKDIVLADIREQEVLTKVFSQERPDVVFHAAALKHLPVLEQFPDEAWKTNVLGTQNVLQAANSVNVKTFINISTDKAADPTSILGKSKKIAEGLTSWFAMENGNKYLSVRFGNVLGSRGSMLPTFSTLIESGGPVTVTHPDVTRFFMTIPEACQLVLQAGAIGRPQDVLILDMGEPVRILDIANRMIEISGKKIEIVFTGLRPGEKMHEDLYGTQEDSETLVHELISHARVAPVSPESLDRSLLK
jgi:dTDP-glucose 4,6-dehydratase